MRRDRWWITACTIDRVCRAQSCAVGTETRNPRAVREASQIQGVPEMSQDL